MTDVAVSGFPAVGAGSRFSKTVTEADIGLFAGVTGDFAPQHIDEEYMRRRPQGRRIAHGVLTLGIASTAASMLCAESGSVAVSYGYDRLRFLAPVFIGDTVEARYEVVRIEPETHKAFASVTVTNQHGELCLVATHILYCY